MIAELERPSSSVGKIAVVVVAVLGVMLHSFGAPERAAAIGGWTPAVGVVLGVAMLAVVAARLLGRNIALLRSDMAAVAALIVMIAAKIAIARFFL